MNIHISCFQKSINGYGYSVLFIDDLCHYTSRVGLLAFFLHQTSLFLKLRFALRLVLLVLPPTDYSACSPKQSLVDVVGHNQKRRALGLFNCP